MPVTKIPSTEVKPGMFIANLDRPWSETPFLFQGFEVREQKEIEDLIRLTQHVYIMIPDEEIELQRLSSSPAPAPRARMSEVLNRKAYEITVSAEEEVKVVRQSHETISRLITEVESIVRSGSEIAFEVIDEPVEIMVDSVVKNPDAYIWLTRIKKFDSYVYADSLNSSVWAAALGRQLGMEKRDLQTLATGALLMDVGKLALPVELLHKKTRLTHSEWEQIKSHVEHGVRILEDTPGTPSGVLDMVRTHHERFNGNGYPDGLAGSGIPLFGQIAGIIDFYVSVTTPRPYAKAVAPSKGLQMLYQQKGTFFDEMLIDNFIQVLSTYPTGSLVELSSGEVAIVVSQNTGLRLKPNVVLLLDGEKKPYGSYPIARLSDYTYGPEEQPVHIVKTLPAGAYGLEVEELSL